MLAPFSHLSLQCQKDVTFREEHGQADLWTQPTAVTGDFVIGRLTLGTACLALANLGYHKSTRAQYWQTKRRERLQVALSRSLHLIRNYSIGQSHRAYFSNSNENALHTHSLASAAGQGRARSRERFPYRRTGLQIDHLPRSPTVGCPLSQTPTVTNQITWLSITTPMPCTFSRRYPTKISRSCNNSVRCDYLGAALTISQLVLLKEVTLVDCTQAIAALRAILGESRARRS